MNRMWEVRKVTGHTAVDQSFQIRTLIFGGQLLDLLMIYLQFPCLSQDGYRGLVKVKIRSQITENLEILESLVSICVKGYRNKVT